MPNAIKSDIEANNMEFPVLINELSNIETSIQHGNRRLQTYRTQIKGTEGILSHYSFRTNPLVSVPSDLCGVRYITRKPIC